MRAIVHFDGGARPNPGPAACAAIVFDELGNTLTHVGTALGTATNNVAEWNGLLIGLRAAREVGATDVVVRGDSRLVIQQNFGSYMHDAKFEPLARQIREMKAGFVTCRGEHVPRNENAAADLLCNRVLDGTYRPFESAVEHQDGITVNLSYCVTLRLPRIRVGDRAARSDVRLAIGKALHALFPVGSIDVRRID